MRHRNIPIFIPHLGCPHQCVFCNQRSITGCREFSIESVEKTVEQALSTIPREVHTEIAFFGGSFTGIERSLMIRLLEIAERYVREKRVDSIRLSTRPDYISEEILEILSHYSVKTIELGLQSMDDEVLKQAKRGHTKADAERACRMIVSHGFSLVGQMMIGLPGATPQSEVKTAGEICRLGASAARIYPTVVFYDTPLCEMTKRGEYTPITVEQAVVRSAAAMRVFLEHDVPCIRIGLCAGEDFLDEARVVGGPNHPALGELVQNAYYYDQLSAAVRAAGLEQKEILLHLPERKISQYVGQNRRNLDRLQRETDTRVRKIVGEKNLDAPMPRLWQEGVCEHEEEQQPCI